MAVEVRIAKCLLRDRRIAAGYSQEHLAKLAGVSTSRISEYESAIKDVHLSTAMKFCAIFDCTIHELFTFEVTRN